MDEAGFAPIEQVLRAAGLGPDELRAIVAADGKSRFEVVGEHVRATQGHSLEGTPVTREGLEASWVRWTSNELVWHGTSVAAARSIAREGLHAGERTHVHLAPTTESRVGKRAGVALLLGVSPPLLRASGRELWAAANGVVLARDVPRACVVQVLGATAKGERAVAEIERALREPG